MSWNKLRRAPLKESRCFDIKQPTILTSVNDLIPLGIMTPAVLILTKLRLRFRNFTYQADHQAWLSIARLFTYIYVYSVGPYRKTMWGRPFKYYLVACYVNIWRRMRAAWWYFYYVPDLANDGRWVLSGRTVNSKYFVSYYLNTLRPSMIR